MLLLKRRKREEFCKNELFKYGKSLFFCYTFDNMAKISYQLMPPEYEDYFRKHLSPNWRFILPRIMRTERFISRAKKKALIEQSKLPEIASLWKGLSSEEKEEWNQAGAVCGMIGWRLFVQEQTIRLFKSFEGVASPSQLFQSWVGHLKLEAPASELKIVQPHPRNYFVSRIAPGRFPLTMLEWIDEDFSLPLKIGLSFRSELTPLPGDYSASFYAYIWSVGEGLDHYTRLEIPFPLMKDWTNIEKTIEDVPGVPIQYDLYFDFSNVEGNFFFDNVVVEHSGFNWARDSSSKMIDAEFSRGFFQVLSNWIPLSLPEGASFCSDYFDFETLSIPSGFGLSVYGSSIYGL
jgi:hypothetical protein